MKDYSQYGEQEEILKHVPEKGHFLDIGAWDPFTFSNTRALFEMGWSGVMVEPSPGAMRKLLGEYGKEPRIRLIQAACISTKSTEAWRDLLKLNVSDDAVSTADAATFEKWKDYQGGPYLGNIWVPFLPVRRVLEAFGPFEFINIDAEGLSETVFYEMLPSQHQLRCLCVEHDGEPERLQIAAKPYGYHSKIMDINLILWR